MSVVEEKVRGGLTEKVASELRLDEMLREHVAVWTTALEAGRKTHTNTSPEANCALHGEGTRQKPRSAVSLTHLDRELPGQNRPNRVTQAGQEAARSTQR